MTGQKIYEIASSFLYEKNGEDADSKTFAVGFLNLLLQECLPYENSIRRFNDAAVLASAPLIASLDDNIDYADDITRVALPYGLASFYFQEAMDNFQAENYRSKYIAALNAAKKYVLSEIEDVYNAADSDA